MAVHRLDRPRLSADGRGGRRTLGRTAGCCRRGPQAATGLRISRSLAAGPDRVQPRRRRYGAGRAPSRHQGYRRRGGEVQVAHVRFRVAQLLRRVHRRGHRVRRARESLSERRTVPRDPLRCRPSGSLRGPDRPGDGDQRGHGSARGTQSRTGPDRPRGLTPRAAALPASRAAWHGRAVRAGVRRPAAGSQTGPPGRIRLPGTAGRHPGRYRAPLRLQCCRAPAREPTAEGGPHLHRPAAPDPATRSGPLRAGPGPESLA